MRDAPKRDAPNLVAPSLDAQFRGALQVRIAQSAPFALDVTFNAQPGEVTALVGPSGSGKTTTLKAIAGLVMPQRGRVAIGGDVWFDSGQNIAVRPDLRRTGFVFQDYALFPHLTARGNVALAMGHVANETRADAAAAVLRRIGIEHLAERSPRDLSGGERQRVGIARALARDPHVLLLDEPFSAVDRPTRERLKSEVRALASTLACPVILVTHDIDEAVALARQLVIIDHGVTIASGTPDELLQAPPSPRAAEIIGVK